MVGQFNEANGWNLCVESLGLITAVKNCLGGWERVRSSSLTRYRT